MARKIDDAEGGLPQYALPYESDALGNLVRISALLASPSFHRAISSSTPIPDDPHAVSAIYTLASWGSLRPGALAVRLHVSPPTVSRLVEKLCAAGLAKRVADPLDSRASIVALTPEGATASAELFRQGDLMMNSLLAGWTPEDREQLTVLLERLATTMSSRTALVVR